MGQPEPVRSVGDFAEFILAARQRKGWTLHELAQRSGVPVAVLSRWESGRTLDPHPDQVRAVCLALGVDPRLAAVTLGHLAPEHASQAPDFTVEELVGMLKDRRVPDTLKMRIIDSLRALQRRLSPDPPEQPASRVDAETYRMLETLAAANHQTASDYLPALIRAEYNRQFPEERAGVATSVEERRARLQRAMGWSTFPALDADAERRLDAALDATEAEARRLYDEGSGRAAA